MSPTVCEDHVPRTQSRLGPCCAPDSLWPSVVLTGRVLPPAETDPILLETDTTPDMSDRPLSGSMVRRSLAAFLLRIGYPSVCAIARTEESSLAVARLDSRLADLAWCDRKAPNAASMRSKVRPCEASLK